MTERFIRLFARWRSIPAAAAIMVALLLAAGLAIIYQNEGSYQAQKQGEAQVQADILAASVTAALDFGDALAATDSVEAMRVNGQIRSAAVYDNADSLFAGFHRTGEPLSPRLPERGSEANQLVTAFAPVARTNEQIGTVRLTLMREPLSRRLTRYSIIGLFVLLAALSVIVLGFAHTALRRANQELEARARALSEANSELEVQMEERTKAEEQLRQAQKMQALGQLTGGIAHDFNNLLTVIQGSAEILQRPNLPEEKRARFASAISQTAGRAAALTNQLLAFARRQPLRPETLDLNEQIVGLVELLDRTLGERILVKTDLAPHLCLVEADPVQLEAAVLNIAVNARDAMPDGGSLILSTAMATHEEGGDGIALSVRDTGSGMDAETLSRVFEPFFTTKDVGRGTGLGLSQVYGFATQSGGEIQIDSKPGEGTAVTLILPCSDKGEVAQRAKATGEAARSTTSARLLVVDDNEEVGAFAESLLDELGYSVVRVTSAQEALEAFEGNAIDAVFTDVVMPGMTGIELARTLRERVPGLPIILTTGFSDQVSETGKDFPLLLKPYKLETLAAMLEEALGGPGGEAAPA